MTSDLIGTAADIDLENDRGGSGGTKPGRVGQRSATHLLLVGCASQARLTHPTITRRQDRQSRSSPTQQHSELIQQRGDWSPRLGAGNDDPVARK